jgi:hypothetical protein
VLVTELSSEKEFIQGQLFLIAFIVTTFLDSKDLIELFLAVLYSH